MNASVGARATAGMLLLTGLLLFLGMLALGFGQVKVSAGDVLHSLLGTQGDTAIAHIVQSIRLPRVLTALVAGAALGVGGVLMQALFRNPMADAWSLGLTAGGQLGVALTVTAAAFSGPVAIEFLTAFDGIGYTIGAALGVVLAAVFMMSLARRVGTITLLVVGLMLGFTVQGLVSVVIHFSNRIGGRVYSGWSDGTFANVTFADMPLMLVPVLGGLLLAVVCAKPLTTLLLGETYARSLGTNVAWMRRLTLAAVVLLVAPVTALCGPVTFIGLIVPHFARAIAGTARILPLLPLAAATGALLALSADMVVHAPWEQHFLHLNAVLALVGAPVVIGLLIFSSTMRGQR